MSELVSKKASAEFIKLANNINPELGNKATWYEVFMTFAEKYDFEFEVYVGKTLTTVRIYKLSTGEDLLVENLKNEDTLVKGSYDLNWDYVFSVMLPKLIESKKIQKPRKRRSDAKEVKPKVKKVTSVEAQDLKKTKSNLYQKIREWRQKGKDVTALVKEYNEICAKLK